MARRTPPGAAPLVRFSAALTSRQGLLAVVRAIRPQQAINATALAQELEDLDLVGISQELRFLESTGLLREKPGTGRCKEFEIVDREAWRGLNTLAKAAAEGRVVVP